MLYFTPAIPWEFGTLFFYWRLYKCDENNLLHISYLRSCTCWCRLSLLRVRILCPQKCYCICGHMKMGVEFLILYEAVQIAVWIVIVVYIEYYEIPFFSKHLLQQVIDDTQLCYCDVLIFFIIFLRHQCGSPLNKASSGLLQRLRAFVSRNLLLFNNFSQSVLSLCSILL